MHMSDALISPAVGATLWLASASLIAYSARRLKMAHDERLTPLMGVLGAFVFAAQMINFTIPLTGSSGHIGGGMLLSILLGPHAAFLVIASILTVQSLFFADGGLLALGCNIFNIGFFPCFVAYPLIYRRIASATPTPRRILVASVLSVIVGLQLGAFAVVVQTVASGISDLPLRTFTLLMQPIHLAIGLGEGLITSAVVTLIWKARPETLLLAEGAGSADPVPMRKLLIGLSIATALVAGILSWFASSHPDGLEWSISRISAEEAVQTPGPLHATAERVQQTTALMPDYDFAPSRVEPVANPASTVNAGTSAAGLLGSVLTLGLVMILGALLKIRRAED